MVSTRQFLDSRGRAISTGLAVRTVGGDNSGADWIDAEGSAREKRGGLAALVTIGRRHRRTRHLAAAALEWAVRAALLVVARDVFANGAGAYRRIGRRTGDLTRFRAHGLNRAVIAAEAIAIGGIVVEAADTALLLASALTFAPAALVGYAHRPAAVVSAVVPTGAPAWRAAEGRPAEGRPAEALAAAAHAAATLATPLHRHGRARSAVHHGRGLKAAAMKVAATVTGQCRLDKGERNEGR
ncbi:hypothetical protein PSAC2689_40347 [Paraburkholderia sacchari]